MRRNPRLRASLWRWATWSIWPDKYVPTSPKLLYSRMDRTQHRFIYDVRESYRLFLLLGRDLPIMDIKYFYMYIQFYIADYRHTWFSLKQESSSILVILMVTSTLYNGIGRTQTRIWYWGIKGTGVWHLTHEMWLYMSVMGSYYTVPGLDADAGYSEGYSTVDNPQWDEQRMALCFLLFLLL